MPHIPPDSWISSPQTPIHCRYWCLGKRRWSCLASIAAGQIAKSSWILGKIAHRSQKLVQYDLARVSRRRMGSLALVSPTWQKLVHFIHISFCLTLYTKARQCNRKITWWQLQISYYKLDFVNHSTIKHQADEALSRLETSCFDQEPVNDNISALLFNLMLVIISKFIDEQSIDQFFKEAASSAGMAGLQYIFRGSGLVIHQGSIVWALPKIVSKVLQEKFSTYSTIRHSQDHGMRRMYDTLFHRS